VLISHRTGVIFSEFVELITGYKTMLNYKGKHNALKIFSLLHFSKTMTNSCRLTLLTDSFRQLDLNQSVVSFVLLFEVHITFGSQSEVPPLFQTHLDSDFVFSHDSHESSACWILTDRNQKLSADRIRRATQVKSY